MEELLHAAQGIETIEDYVIALWGKYRRLTETQSQLLANGLGVIRIPESQLKPEKVLMDD